MQKSRLVNIFLVVFVDLVGFGLILPLMPYYAGQYGGSEFLIGLLVAAYAAAQFVGAPLLGRLSDRFGRRPILVVSIAGTAFGFLLLGLADPLGRGIVSLVLAHADPSRLQTAQNAAILGVMFVSRMLSGLTGGNITVAQAYIADVTDERSRAGGLGLIGAAFGLGFILGPVIGGVLSQQGFALPALASAGLATLNLIGILAVLPESLTAERKAELAKQKRRPLVSLPDMVAKMRRPRLGPLLTIRLVCSLAGALFMSMFTLWAKDRLGLSPQATSYLLAYFGLLAVVVQVGLIGRLTKRFSEARLISWSVVIQAAALLAWAFAASVPVLMVVLLPFALANAVFNTVINSAITWAVPPQEMGDALGTASAFESLSRVISPSVGGWLLGALGAWAPGLAAAVILAALTPYAWRRLIVSPDPPLAVPLPLA